MDPIFYFTIIAQLFNSFNLITGQTLLQVCDYKKYPLNGCEDELGSDCDQDLSMCKCKSGNWVVIENKFCFPKECPTDEYYDHNYRKCEPKRKATLNSEENYCRQDFHCRGKNVHCQQYGWNYRCVCNRGFIYDTSTQDCQPLKGLQGYCRSDTDCDVNTLRQLYCIDNSCQCNHGFSYNNDIEGCEDNKRIKQRDSETRTLIYVFIIMGVLFGAALSMSSLYGSSTSTTKRLLLKRIVESHHRTEEQAQEPESQSETNDKTENLINNRETA